MILEFHRRLAISAKDSAGASGKFPGQSAQAYIHLTSGRAHRYESSAAGRASLQKASRNLLNAIQIEEMPRQMSHDLQSSLPGLGTVDPALQILEKPVLGLRHLAPLRH